MAVSPLSISALLKTKARCEDFKECINKGTNFLLQELPNLRRATPMAIYNIWSHAYGIQALCLLDSKTKDPKTKQQIHGVIQQQVNMLEKYESIDGGWGYYDFRALTKKPSGSSISFVNATGLVALKDAEKVGIEKPLKLVTRSISAIHRQKLPDYNMYASHCITTLPSQERQTYQIKMVDTLTPQQEKDGSWWDFPLYNYHKPYGTAMAILSLNSCLPDLPKN